jgi:hypothetical protein
MSNILIEIKNEYTTHLINTITPSIFEGLQSIYNTALEITKNNKAQKNENVLKIFQTFLQDIPKWNTERIANETQRILVTSHSIGWLNNLVKSTIKANLLIFTTTNKKYNSTYYNNITIEQFIHKIYVECAREIWYNPYLLYHECSPYEIKQNQRECMILIKECIKEGIRKMLPLKEILEFYLKDENEIVNDNNINNITPNLEYKVNSTLEEPTINTRILGIIEPSKGNISSVNNKNYDNTSINLPINNGIYSMTSSNIDSMISSEKSENKKTNKNAESINKLNKIEENTLDTKIKKILQKDLGTDSDIETTLNYNNTNFQEIFSNSVDKGDNTDKNRFFKNYMKL